MKTYKLELTRPTITMVLQAKDEASAWEQFWFNYDQMREGETLPQEEEILTVIEQKHEEV